MALLNFLSDLLGHCLNWTSEKAKNEHFKAELLSKQRNSEALFNTAHNYLIGLVRIFDEFSDTDKNTEINIYMARRKVATYLKNFNKHLKKVSLKF